MAGGFEDGGEVKRSLLLLALFAVAGALGSVYWRSLRPELPPPPTQVELQTLLERRDALQKRLTEVVAANGEKSLATAPRGGVMIGVPTSFTRSILDQIVTGLFGEVTLTLKNLKVHKEGEVRVNTLFGRKQTMGKYVLDVKIHEVQGILRPGKPKVVFGRDRVALSLPVRLAEGQGNADLRLRWDSQGLAAKLACGDVDVTKAVTGGVIPQDYTLAGAFKIARAGSAITLLPDFPEDLRVRIRVDPSEQAWRAVEEVVKDQRAVCEAALNKIDIKEVLGNVLGKGFNVRIPHKLIKPIRLPAGLKQSLDIQGIKLALKLKLTGLLVSEKRIWYGADIGFEKSGRLPDVSPSPSPAPAASPAAKRYPQGRPPREP